MAFQPEINVEALSYYLQRIRTFIQSKKKRLQLPCISTELRDIFVRIVQEGVGFLQGEEFSDDVKLEGNKLSVTLEAHKTLKLTHEYKDGTKYGSNVFVYVKVMTTKFQEPLRKPSEEQTTTFDDIPSDTEVNHAFKTWCLNAALKFVKDDSLLAMNFPPMVPEQADFVVTTISQGIGDKQTEYGFRSIYAPLWEAMRLFRLKYQYKVLCDDCPQNMKQVIFEKMPKSKPIVPDKMEEMPKLKVLSESKPETVVSEKMEEIPKLHVAKESESITESRVPEDMEEIPKREEDLNPMPASSKDSRTTPPMPITSSNIRETGSIWTRRMRSVRDHIETGQISETFIQNALKRILAFLYEEKEGSIVFKQVDNIHSNFLCNVIRLSTHEEAFTLFNIQCQKYLNEIKSIVTQYNIQKPIYQVKNIRSKKKNGPIDVKVIKQGGLPKIKLPVENNDAVNGESCQDKTDSPDLSIDARKAAQKQKLKCLKEEIVQIHGESFIENVLQKIHDLLSPNEKKTTLAFEEITELQANFLTHVCAQCQMEEVYPMFSEKCQTLLSSIKVRAESYVLEYSNLEWYGGDDYEIFADFTITKKHNGQAKKPKKPNKSKAATIAAKAAAKATKNAAKAAINAARAASRVHYNRFDLGRTHKEMLIEALAQPVQCDKATKIMQNMGWTGGALGLRGNGITEPIMPTLDSVRLSRAGIGHASKKSSRAKAFARALEDKPKAPDPPEPAPAPVLTDLLPDGIKPLSEIPAHLLPPGILIQDPYKTIHLGKDYRECVLRHVLRLLSSEEEESVKFRYTTMQLKKREVRPNNVFNFIKEVCRVLSARRTMILAEKVEMKLVDEILNELNVNTDLVISDERLDGNSCLVHVSSEKYYEETTNDAEIVDYIDLTSDDNTESCKTINTGNTDVLGVKEDTTTLNNSADEEVINAMHLDVTKSYGDNLDTVLVENVQNKESIDLNLVETVGTGNCDDDSSKYLEIENEKQCDPILEHDKPTEIQTNEGGQIKSETSVKMTNAWENNNNTYCEVDKSLINNNNDKTNNIQEYSDVIDPVTRSQIIPPSDKALTAPSNKTNVIDPSNMTNIAPDDKTDAKASEDRLTNEDQNAYDAIKNDGDDCVTDNSDNVKIDKEQALFPKKEFDLNKAVNTSKTSDLIANSIELGNNLPENSSCEAQRDKFDFGISQYSHGRRRSTDTLRDGETIKRIKLSRIYKKLCIVHKDHPQTKIDIAKAREIQHSLINTIDNKDKTPVLFCEGIQNGGLVYGCHDEKSVLFIVDLIKNIHDLRILYDIDVVEVLAHKMAFKMFTFLEENVSQIFKRLELYNKGLSTSQWQVIKKEQYDEFIVIYVNLDEVSLNYIRDSNFVLYAGNDSAKFTIIWD